MHKGTLVKRILTNFVENKGTGEGRRTNKKKIHMKMP